MASLSSVLAKIGYIFAEVIRGLFQTDALVLLQHVIGVMTI